MIRGLEAITDVHVLECGEGGLDRLSEIAEYSRLVRDHPAISLRGGDNRYRPYVQSDDEWEKELRFPVKAGSEPNPLTPYSDAGLHHSWLQLVKADAVFVSYPVSTNLSQQNETSCVLQFNSPLNSKNKGQSSSVQ